MHLIDAIVSIRQQRKLELKVTTDKTRGRGSDGDCGVERVMDPGTDSPAHESGQ